MHHGQCIGRDPSCHLVLAGNEVSRRHVEVRRTGALPVLRDLESRNGLFVNGTQVREQHIGPGDVVRIGEWVGVVYEPAAAASASLPSLEGWYVSDCIAEFLPALRKAVLADLPIIVQGETGAGKEHIARAAHALSGRSGQFVALDCGALPEHLVEAQLFGHRKGAFTGADRAQAGLFRAAHGGTLFLDEVLNLSPALQAKLLRVLEQREVLPLGETRPVAVDVRIVAAAQEPLTHAAEDGRFRRDLAARLEGFTFRLPALRERRQDIVPLLRYFLARQGAELSADARFVESLLLYDWPLNVRELRLFVLRQLALEVPLPWRRSTLPDRMLTSRTTATPRAEAEMQPRAPTDDAAAFEELVAALRAHEGNLSRAASALGITRARAYRLFAAHPSELSAVRKELGS